MAKLDNSCSVSKNLASRRDLLRGLAAAPVAVTVAAQPRAKALSALHGRYQDEAAKLERTKDGRSVSRSRYQKAERWMASLEAGFLAEPRFAREALHQVGFVAQQALCAYLLDVGFADSWNARHIKQDIAKALAYANAGGFAHHCPEMARLAAVLSPYWKWGYHYDQWDNDQPDTGGFVPVTIVPIMRTLLNRVHDLTGHPRPKGCRRERQEARS